MTDEERQRAMDFIKDSLRARLSPPDDIDPEKAAADAKLAAERRKLDRDMDRLERVLRKIVTAPRQTKRQLEKDERWREFKAGSEKRFAESKEIGARTDAKIKALQDDLQRRRDAQGSS